MNLYLSLFFALFYPTRTKFHCPFIHHFADGHTFFADGHSFANSVLGPPSPGPLDMALAVSKLLTYISETLWILNL